MNYIREVALFNNDETFNVIVEICPGTSDKAELIMPSCNRLTVVRQVEGKYPFYYGSFPRTHAGDNDPLDMILFTDKQHSPLEIVKVEVIGAVKTVDAGEQDDKIICVEADCGLKNVSKQFKKAMKFLKTYKGKDADMVIEKKLVDMEGAEQLVKQAHESYKKRNTSTGNKVVIQQVKVNANKGAASIVRVKR